MVHSSAHDKRRHNRLERELAASLKEASTLASVLMKKRFFCRADAEQAAKELLAKTTRFHRLDIEIIECPRYARGRPAKGAQRIPVATEYELSVTIIEKEKLVAKHREVAGCFVLLSSVPADWD